MAAEKAEQLNQWRIVLSKVLQGAGATMSSSAQYEVLWHRLDELNVCSY